MSKPHLPDRHLSPWYIRSAHRLEDFVDDFNLVHLAFKLCAFCYIAFVTWITWSILPLNGHWRSRRETDKLHIVHQNLTNYFDDFKGSQLCGISLSDLYIQPQQNAQGFYDRNEFCPSRKSILEAMSYGDVSITIVSGCNYRWYTVDEICMILERFDKVLFIGDSTLQAVYAGLAILLRRDMQHGAVESWTMDEEELSECSCDNQFGKESCRERHIVNSDSALDKESNLGGPSTDVCSQASYVFLEIDEVTPSHDVVPRFRDFVPRGLPSAYRSIPIIYSVAPSIASVQTAAQSLLSYLALADGTGRKTPMLFLGPTAPGHIDIRGRKGNQEIWSFHNSMAQTATDNKIEVLGMWNLTVQANSNDGLRYGEGVSITQAMMVVNWLARLPSV